MAIYWLEGFDTYENSTRVGDIYTVSGAISLVTGVIDRAVQFSWTAGIFANLNISAEALYIGAHYRQSAFGTTVQYLIRLFESNLTDYLEIRITTSGNIALYRNTTLLATSTLTLPTGAFYHLKIYLFKSLTSSGICKIWYNNSLFIDYQGQTAVSSTTTGRIQLFSAFSGDIFSVFDNLYIADEDLGELYARAIVPVAAGFYTQFSPQGSSNNWDNVDEIQTADSNFNFSSTNGAIDTYKYTDNPVSSGYIRAIRFAPNLSKSLGDYTGGRCVVRFNGSDWVSDNIISPPITNREYIGDILSVNPITENPWELSQFSGSSRVEFGMQVVK